MRMKVSKGVEYSDLPQEGLKINLEEYARDQISVRIANDVLTIEAERPIDHDESVSKASECFVEHYFLRGLGVSHSFENGVLTITPIEE